jgi:anti-sigma B factor antagonist
MKVAIADEGGHNVVRVAGEVDLDSSPDLWTQLHQALSQGRQVKVNLRDVSYIDSSGVAILIKGLKHAARSKQSYRLVDPSPRVMAVLELAQLPQLFEIERTEGT